MNGTSRALPGRVREDEVLGVKLMVDARKN